VPVLCVIQARLGSTRLPLKALELIGGKPLIQHVVERAQQIRGVDDVVLAVPSGEVVELSYAPHTSGPDVPENDVLARFASVAQMYPTHETIIRLTGDCCRLDPRIAENVLGLFYQTRAWYAWNVCPGYTDGEDVEVFRREALMRAHREATDHGDREHVTTWIRRHYAIVTLKPQGPARRKTSVDTAADLAHVRALYAH
jgi:spore coat polysaccharide biosynthesis protein SpsF